MEFRIGPYDSYLENGDIYSSDDFLIRTQELIVNDFKFKIPVDCEELKLTYFEDPIFQMGPLRPRNKEYPIRSFDLKILSRLTNLKKLDMSFIKISVYSINFDNITLLTKLEELRLPNNDLRFLPLKILELTNLKKLSLIDSLFQRFNFDIDKLVNLEVLELGNSKIKRLGDKLKGLEKLKFLDISYTNIDGVEFKKILEDSFPPNLESLKMIGTDLKNVDIDLSILTKLKFLDITLCKKFGEFILPISIEEIKMNGRSGSLTNLLKGKTWPNLKIICAQEVDLSLDAADFPSLSTFDEHGYDGFFLAPLLEILNLKNARNWRYDFNLDLFPNLIELNLDKIRSITKIIQDYENDKLKKFSFTSSNLENLKFLRKYENLEHLNLDSLQESDLDISSISNLIHLTELNFRRTTQIFFDEDSDYLHKLTNLKFLDIGFLDSVPMNTPDYFTKIFGNNKLKELIKLNIYGNKIEKIPEFTDGLLEKIEIINYNINNISTIPETIKNLTKLTNLNLEENNFSVFPKEICNIKNLNIINFKHSFQNELIDKIIEVMGGHSLRFNGQDIPKLCEGMKKFEPKLEVCDDNYIELLFERNLVEFSRQYVTNITNKQTLSYDWLLSDTATEEETNERFDLFIDSLFAPECNFSSISQEDCDNFNKLFNFYYTVTGGVAVDWGGVLKALYENLFNKKFELNNIFVTEPQNNKLDLVIDYKIENRFIKIIGAMIGGYTRGLSNFNTPFNFTHSFALIYRFRHNYLLVNNNFEPFFFIIKKFAVHYLNEDLLKIKELPTDSNKLHIFSFLFAEFIDNFQVIDDTTYCKVVKEYNNSGNNKTTYEFIFKGCCGDQVDDDEEYEEERLDYLSNQLIIETGEEYQPYWNKVEDLFLVFEDKTKEWWLIEEHLEEFKTELEKIRNETGGPVGMIGGSNSNNYSNDEEEEKLYPFINDFIQQILTNHELSFSMMEAFEYILDPTRFTFLKNIDPFKLYMTLCPNTELSIKKVTNTFIFENLNQEVKDFIINIFIQDGFIEEELEIINTTIGEISEGESFDSLFEDYQEFIKKIVKYITGSSRIQRNLKFTKTNTQGFAAHTCFNHLEIPNDLVSGGITNQSVKNTFLESLIKSVLMGGDFGLAGIKIKKTKSKFGRTRTKSIKKNKSKHKFGRTITKSIKKNKYKSKFGRTITKSIKKNKYKSKFGRTRTKSIKKNKSKSK